MGGVELDAALGDGTPEAVAHIEDVLNLPVVLRKDGRSRKSLLGHVDDLIRCGLAFLKTLFKDSKRRVVSGGE